jgi:DnaJ-domain-containing protein 1
MKLLRGYAASIAQITGVTDPEILHAIEEIMRIDRTGLDGMDAREFHREARIAHQVYQQLSPGDQAWYRTDGRRVS